MFVTAYYGLIIRYHRKTHINWMLRIC